MVATKKKKKKAHYLDNQELLKETIISKEQGKMTDRLASMIMLLVNHYATKGNVANYTYNDDMRAYAIMMHMSSWKSFKLEKSTNAFAFFTQCTKNSFRQFLNKERRQRDIRDELLVHQGLEPSHTYTANYENSDEQQDYNDTTPIETKPTPQETLLEF